MRCDKNTSPRFPGGVAFSLGLCMSQLWKEGKKSNIFLKSTCYALPAPVRHSSRMTNLMQVRGKSWHQQWGKGMVCLPCLSHASPLPGSCQLILQVLTVIFPPTLAHKISFCIFSCTCFSHPPYSVLCFKSASSTVIS